MSHGRWDRTLCHEQPSDGSGLGSYDPRGSLHQAHAPGQIDNDYVHDFRDVAHITVEEVRTLVNWIEQGAKNTDNNDPLAEYSPELVKWAYGDPDMVIPIPPQQIPATGVQDYRNIPLALDLEEDIWVKAVEFEAGDPTVLHIIAFAWPQRYEPV